MTNLFADASSIILLEKADLFDMVLSAYEVCMPESVFAELTSNHYPDEARFKKSHTEKRFSVAPINTPSQSDSIFNKDRIPGKLVKLDKGEKDVIRLYFSGPEGFILTDDGAAARYCAYKKIPFINALLVPKIFWYAGSIKEENCLAYMDFLLKIGRYAAPIAQYARLCTVDDLKRFLPE